jgi:hypothetical protein
MPDSPFIPAAMPVPQKINGRPVVAAVCRAPKTGEVPGQYEVICYDHDGEPDLNSSDFTVWRACYERPACDGYPGHWIPTRGHYKLTWEQACETLINRAGLENPT